MNWDFVKTLPEHNEEGTYCPFCNTIKTCNLEQGLHCTYGLTACKIPKYCPLRKGMVTVAFVGSGEVYDDGAKL